MGQIIATLQEKFQGKDEWKKKQIRPIVDKVYDRIKEEATDKDHLTFEDLYIGVLCIYNDLNKLLPGPHNDPPNKAKLIAMMQEHDMNLDGQLDRDEFAEFINKLTTDTITSVGQNLLIALVVAPTVALLTKRATEGVPVVGKTIEKIPSSVYASAVALAVVLLQNAQEQLK